MRLSLIPLVAALAVAVCVFIAFIATGLGAISDLFILMAVAVVVFLAWSALRRQRSRERARNPMRQGP
jgi:hypothetical protein